MLLVVCNNTKDYFSWELKKIYVKFHKNCENTGKILKLNFRLLLNTDTFVIIMFKIN